MKKIFSCGNRFRKFTAILMMMLFSQCATENDGKDKYQLASVSTVSASMVTSTSAICTGYIESSIGVNERGICWSRENPSPTIDDYHAIDVSGENPFQITLSSLAPSTTYYFRAYAINNIGIAYGSVASFSTLIASNCGSLVDIDGNTYETITIGSRCWAKKNLNVSHYRNGDVIPQVQNTSQWVSLTTGAWCYYENQTSNGTIYGKLYNWFAVNDARGLAPAGSHVASQSDFQNIALALGNVNLGGMMKSTNLWEAPNTGANNQSGFTGLPGGYRWVDGLFASMGRYGEWWTSTENPFPFAQNFSLGYTYDFLANDYRDKINGYAVRCVAN